MRVYALALLVVVEATGCAPKTEASLAPRSREARESSIATARTTVQQEVERAPVSDAVSEAPTEAAVIATSANGKLRVTVLPLEIHEKLSACACTFSPINNRDGSAFLTGWLDPSDGAWMQINGSTENLTIDSERIRRANGKHGRPEFGDKTTYSLSNTEYKSDLACSISDTCWESGECESIGYECEVTIRSIDAIVTVPATGICGC